MISSVNSAASPSVWQTLASNGTASAKNPFASTLDAATPPTATTPAAAPATTAPAATTATPTPTVRAHHGHGHHHHASGSASGSSQSAINALPGALTNPTYSANGTAQASATPAHTFSMLA